MRTRLRPSVAIFALAFNLAVSEATAVVDQQLQIQGTNLVLSWPSQGYEYYMVEYRPNLVSTTPWIQLTNCYRTTGTNRTTYTIPCCALNDLGGEYSMEPLSTSEGELAGSPASGAVTDTDLWAAPADGSGDAVPLAIYPPGFNTNTLVIVERLREAVRSRSAAFTEGSSVAAGFGETGNPATDSLTSGGCNCPDIGFFRVWHIPDFLGSITNYIFDGPTFIAVDFKDYLDRVENIDVLLDGQPTSDAIFISQDYAGVTYWGLGIYFDLFPSGTHTLQLRTTLRLDEKVGDKSVFLVVSNLSQSITLGNEVTFTNWDDLIQTTNFTFQAQTKTNSTDWWIDIYDANNNYVNGGSGHTSNGQISWTWDLKDTLGNPRDDLDNDPFFSSYVTFATAGAGLSTRSTPAAQIGYPNVGAWLISYSDRFNTDAGFRYTSADQHYGPAIDAMAGWVSYRSIPVSEFPIKFGTNVYTQTERNNSWSDLKAALSQGSYRNFYYYGHGGPNTIGTDGHEFDTNGYVTVGLRLPGSKAYLESGYVQNVLTFNKYAGSRPYRFVWLDGCSTANGNWPTAFGVDKTSYDLDHYTNNVANPKHRRPSAFMGWNQTIGGPGWGNSEDFWNFREQCMGWWSYYWQTETLSDAIDEGRLTSDWPPGGSGQLSGALRVYGYTNMLFNGYNQKADWKWP
jgi:hypothetical protein